MQRLISVFFVFSPFLLSERDHETAVIKKLNQFLSFKFGDVQSRQMKNFLGVVTILDFFRKTYSLFIKTRDGTSANQSQGIYKNKIPIIENLLKIILLLYRKEIVDRNLHTKAENV